MARVKSSTSKVGRITKSPRFGSRITPHINDLLRIRYAEKKPVSEALAWLETHGLPTPRDTFQKFLRRVLNLLPDKAAKPLGVDLEFLQGVRRRLGLPLAPSSHRAPRIKAVERFPAKSRRRRVHAGKKPKRQAVLPAHPSRPEPTQPSQPSSTSTAAPSVAPPPEATPQMFGTPDHPQGTGDWKILNERACNKVWARDRSVMLHEGGMIISYKTKKAYTEESLAKEFGLTPNEARAFSMTFPERDTWK